MRTKNAFLHQIRNRTTFPHYQFKLNVKLKLQSCPRGTVVRQALIFIWQHVFQPSAKRVTVQSLIDFITMGDGAKRNVPGEVMQIQPMNLCQETKAKNVVFIKPKERNVERKVDNSTAKIEEENVRQGSCRVRGINIRKPRVSPLCTRIANSPTSIIPNRPFKPINVVIVSQNILQQFRIRRNMPFRRIMHIFCDRAGLNINAVRFRHRGRPVNVCSTAAHLNMKDWDTVEVFQCQF